MQSVRGVYGQKDSGKESVIEEEVGGTKEDSSQTCSDQKEGRYQEETGGQEEGRHQEKSSYQEESSN